MSIFKAYDVRGTVPDQLNPDVAYRFGIAAAKYFQQPEIVVGRDMRLSGDEIFAALARGIRHCGSDVIDVGVVDSPHIYYVVGKHGYKAGIMITASHNPPQYNGFKLCRENAIPLSYDTGLNKIEEIFNANPRGAAEPNGTIKPRDCYAEYIAYLQKFVTRELAPLKVIIDAGNGMAGKFVGDLLKPYPVQLALMYPELDGSFPHHEANPLKEENVRELCARVKAEKADLGIAFDGDADRVAFIDNTGEMITCDLITILIARAYLSEQPGSTILYDLRSSWAVKEEIEAAGGKPIMSRVGHSYIKQQLRDTNGIFAGELSGHYYFRDNYFCDSGFLAMFKVLQMLSDDRRPVAEIIRPLKRYSASGEINSRVADPAGVLTALEKKYATLKQFSLDGLSIEASDWWCNVRSSNTEPVVRLNLEAKSKALMEKMRDEVLGVIRG